MTLLDDWNSWMLLNDKRVKESTEVAKLHHSDKSRDLKTYDDIRGFSVQQFMFVFLFLARLLFSNLSATVVSNLANVFKGLASDGQPMAFHCHLLHLLSHVYTWPENPEWKDV